MAISLKEGDRAPFFRGINQEGKEISLNDYKGKKIILYFYPKDNTSGCTAEACSLNDNYDTLTKILQDYGVWGEKSMYGRKYMGVFRTTFLIDGNGIIERVFTKVDTKNAAEQIIKSLD